MTDNEQIKVFLPILNSGLTNQGITATVQSTNQPTSQGVPNGNTVFYSKISDKILGQPHKLSTYNATTGNQDETITQRVETTWQIGALVRQVPSLINTDTITSSDLINIAYQILTLDSTLSQFVLQNAGIVQVTNIRNPYFDDDRGQHEASPSFDFTIVHNRVLNVTGNSLTAIDNIIDRV